MKKLFYNLNHEQRVLFASQALNALLQKKGIYEEKSLCRRAWEIADTMMLTMEESYVASTNSWERSEEASTMATIGGSEGDVGGDKSNEGAGESSRFREGDCAGEGRSSFK
jgi:hypothetical protein|tara:strand:- start:278 stop:610 length:333 start_codon:yes stop_codon:yes gene_type:complete